MDKPERSQWQSHLAEKLVSDMEAMRDASTNLSLALQNLKFIADVPQRLLANETASIVIKRAKQVSKHQ